MHTDRMDWWESAREANAELKALRLETGGGLLARLKRWRRKRSLIAHIRFCDPPPGWLEPAGPRECFHDTSPSTAVTETKRASWTRRVP